MQIVQELRQKYPLVKLLQFAKIPRSTFYYYLHQSERPGRYSQVKEKIQRIYEANHGRYGYRRITIALHKEGVCVNHKTVLKFMRQMGLLCRVRMKKCGTQSIGTAFLCIRAKPQVGHRRNGVQNRW